MLYLNVFFFRSFCSRITPENKVLLDIHVYTCSKNLPQNTITHAETANTYVIPIISFFKNLVHNVPKHMWLTNQQLRHKRRINYINIYL